MRIEEVKESIGSVLNDSYSMQLYFVLKREDQFVLRLADLEDDSAAPEVQALFTGNIRNQILENEDLQLCQLSTKKSKEAFLKLMNDAFLRSELTKQYYEASAKDQLSAE